MMEYNWVMLQKALNDMGINIYIFYLKIRYWLRLQEFKRKHISISFKDGKVEVVIMSHDRCISKLKKRIRLYRKKHSFKETIKQSLIWGMKDCFFIVFESKDEKKFVQFLTDRGKLNFLLPMSRRNGFERYRLALLGLLSEFNFVRKDLLDDKFPSFRRYKYFFSIDGEEKGYCALKAKFGKNCDLAAEYAYRALNEVMKVKPEDMKVDFG
jgi:hypothetical protein